jgi:hypothetical protein
MPESPKQQAEKIFSQILKGKEVSEHFDQYFKRQVTVSGQSIEHWNEHFKVDFPQALELSQAQAIAARLMALHQEASFYFSIAQAKVALMKRGSDSNYLARFAAIVEEQKAKGGRLPSAQTLENLAKIDGDAAASAYTLVEVEMKFWKEKLSNLETSRKLLENATMSISTELKYLHTESGLDSAERRQNNGGYKS